MDEWKRSGQIPAFGNWEVAKDMPITQYFECARQAGVVRHSSSSGDSDRDLYALPASSLKKRRRNREREKGRKQQQQQQQGKGRVWDWDVSVSNTHTHKLPQPPRSKPVDEDLYKIPPELLHSTTNSNTNTNRNKMLRFISHCLLPTACLS